MPREGLLFERTGPSTMRIQRADLHPDSETDRCLPFLLAGGRGARLFELTDRQCKPALAFGAGEGRIVDFILAALARAGFARLFVASQYRPKELSRHLQECWAHHFPKGVLLRDGGALSPYGYRGTADAVRMNATLLDAHAPREVMILSGDHVLDLDLKALLAHHRGHGRAATVVAAAVPRHEARGFGVFEEGPNGQVVGFAQKPARPAPMRGDPERSLASAGIYVFDWIWLKRALRADAARAETSHDFGHDILPLAMSSGELAIYRMPGTMPGQGAYWRDVGTLDAYRRSQLDFVAAELPVPLPQTMRRPVTSARDSFVEGSILMPGCSVGRRCHLRDTLVGPGVRLPDGFQAGLDPEEDARWFRRSAGGTLLITAEMMSRRETALRRPAARPLFRHPPQMAAVPVMES